MRDAFDSTQQMIASIAVWKFLTVALVLIYLVFFGHGFILEVIRTIKG